ncbi:MAG: DUF3592 domain-containing protein [Morganella morganii]|nr:DUF3592 domain-containing protein [Morganella morganii]HDU8582218.1 DUF3592 domain-containing protein [Morganella morganii]
MFTQLRYIAGTFVVLGLVMLLAAACLAYQTYQEEQTRIITTGLITDITRSRSYENKPVFCPVIRHTAGGESYTFTSSHCFSSRNYYAAGDFTDIAYAPGEPQNAEIHSLPALYAWPIFFIFMGGPFALIGSLPFIIMAVRKKSGKHLLQAGTPVRVKMTGVISNTTISINGRNPYQIEAQLHNPADNTLTFYYSTNLGFDPTPYIHQEYATVYLDKRNPRKYYMDISFLPRSE